VAVHIEPEPTEEERQAILAALAAAAAGAGRNPRPSLLVEEAECAAAVEIIQPDPPMSPSAPSA
jgi:septal ring factor EnvC (AmiA/AmiB activator)